MHVEKELRAGAPALPVVALLFLFLSTEPGAAEWPVFRAFTQSCFHGIVLDVLHGLREVFAVSDITIKVIQHPELPASVEKFVCLVRSKGFERLHDVGECIVFKSGREHMNVVRHNHPCR